MLIWSTRGLSHARWLMTNFGPGLALAGAFFALRLAAHGASMCAVGRVPVITPTPAAPFPMHSQLVLLPPYRAPRPLPHKHLMEALARPILTHARHDSSRWATGKASICMAIGYPEFASACSIVIAANAAAIWL
jgi:hypothetical protein